MGLLAEEMQTTSNLSVLLVPVLDCDKDHGRAKQEDEKHYRAHKLVTN